MKVAYIAYQYPTLTQTFIQREVKAVASQGVEIEVHAMRGTSVPEGFQMPFNATLHPFFLIRLWTLLWRMPCELIRDPGMIVEGIRLLNGKKWRGWDNALINLLGIGFAFATASRFRKSDVDHFHGVWATGMTTAAAMLARMTGKTFSMGAHAFDVYRFGGDCFLVDKISRAKFVHTTTEANVRHLKSLSPRSHVVLSRRGLESLPDLVLKKQKPMGAFQMLSVARLVPKKGLEYQIEVCAELKKRGLSFVHRIAGDGPLKAALDQKVKDLGLEKEVLILGALSQAEVQDCYKETDLFWHAGLVDAQGDRDGLPNVIPEALSWGICVLSSPTPGADEAVKHQKTGWVVDPREIGNTTEVIEGLSRNEQLRKSLGEAGRVWVEENFMSSKNAAILVSQFQKTKQQFS